MDSEKFDLSEAISLGTSVILISSISYVVAFSSIFGMEIIKYFEIGDYLNISIKTVMPALIGMIIGYILSFIENEYKENKKKIKVIIRFVLIASIFGILFLNILSLIGVIKSVVVQIINVLILTVLLYFSKEKHVDKIKRMSSYIMIRYIILFILYAYFSGTINANAIINNKNNDVDQTIIFEDGSEYYGRTLFLLNDFIIVYEKGNRNYQVYKKEDIKVIKELIK